MDSSRKPRSSDLVISFLALSIFAADGLAAPRTNQRAQSLARQLGPSSINANSGTAGDIEAIRKRAIPILETLELNYRTSGPAPASLMENAYDLRKDVGPYERIVTGQMLLKAWKEASAMGLFDENRKFKARIGEGRFAGQSAVFEHVIPPEIYPAGSTHLANFRIVAPDRKREPGRELTAREKAFGSQLVKVVAEIEKGKTLAAIEKKMVKPKAPPTNAVGQTMAEAKRRWQAEVEAAGEDFKKKPNVRIDGRVTATPSRMNKDRWRVSGEIRNLSPYPTEVTMNWWMVGITDKKRDHYIMAKGSQKMELRKGEAQDIILFSKSRGGYKKKADDHDGLSKQERARSRARMRGFILEVVHDTGQVSYFASDRHLEGYVDDRDNMSIGTLEAW